MALSTATMALVALLVAGGLGTAAYLATSDTECRPPSPEGASAFASAAAGCATSASACPEGDVTPFAPQPQPDSGVVRFQIKNTERSVIAHVCLVDATGTKRYEERFSVPAEETSQLDVPAPVGPYTSSVSLEPSGSRLGSARSTNAADIDLGDCAGRGVVVPLTVRSESSSHIATRSTSTRCFDAEDADPDGGVQTMGTRTGFPPLDPDIAARLAPAALAFAGTLAAISGLVYLSRSDPVRWAWLALFSRVTRPRALDQAVRAQVHAVIEAEPGVRAEEVRRRLQLAPGQTAHHLRILVQNGLVERLRIGGVQHHFAAGRHGRDAMRRLAVLNRGAARRLYDELRRKDGVDVSTMAKATGLSVAYVSRLAAQLADVGLVDRRREGRRMVLRATAT